MLLGSPLPDVWSDERVSVLVIAESKEMHKRIASALANRADSFEVRYARTRDEAFGQLRFAAPDLILVVPVSPDGRDLLNVSELNTSTPRPFALVTEHRDLKSEIFANPGFLDTISPDELTPASLPRTLERLIREWQGITRIREIEQELNVSQEKHRRAKLLGHPLDWEWDVRNECLVYCSQEFAALHEMTVEETLAHFCSLDRDHSVIHPDDFEHWQQAKAASMDGSMEVEYRIVVRSGAVKHIREISKIDFDESNQPYCQFGSVRDITETKRAEQALRESNERYERLYHETPSMFLTLNASGKVLSANTYGARHLGYEPEQLVGKNFDSLVDDRDSELALSTLRKVTASPEHVHHWDSRLIRRDGTQIWARKTARAIDHEKDAHHIFLVGEDITETRKLSEQLSYQASHDPLTQLLNRREFDLRLKRIIDTARTDGSEHALCYLDLDQFKIVNDNCGHTAGDELLRQLADLLSSCMRKRDTLARLGGDEFGILMEHCTEQQARRVAETVRQKIEDFRFAWDDRVFSVGASIGLVPIANNGLTSTDVLKQADAACYAAKEAGRNRIHVYTEKDSTLSRRQGEMQLVEQLHRALEDDRLALYQQEIVPLEPELAGGNFHEVLVRMTDETGRNVAPASLLAAAERYGVSPRLDRWIVTRVFEHLGDTQKHGSAPPRWSINLSGLSLGDEGFREFLLELFSRTGISPARICFEITETAAISNLTVASGFIKNLRELGCSFALDDFGKGLSSFAYLKTLPVDYLKIDGLFVRDIVTDPVSFGMVKSIHDIGKLMGLQTIAESVENDAILGKMREIGVDFVQGFGVSEPVPID